jgi:Flp pilus assembly protein TadG
VLWLPVFVLIIGLTTDAALTFHTHSRMWDAARDTARRAATGQLDARGAEDYASSRLPGGGGFVVQVDDSGADEVVVTITARSGDLGLTGVLDVIGDGTLRSVYRMRKEVWTG